MVLVKAVYHHDIRQELLDRTGDLSRYSEPEPNYGLTLAYTDGSMRA